MTHDEEKKVADIIAEMAAHIESLQRENEALKNLIDGDGCTDPDKIDALFRRAEAAEAEVKRLRDQLDSAACLLETLSEDRPSGDVDATMMRVMAQRNRTALASREGDTHKPVAYVCAADMELLGKISDGWDFSMSPKPRPDLGMNMALYAAPLTETSKPDPVLWVSPVDLRAWEKAKAGEIWAWSENLEGECIPLYTALSAQVQDVAGWKLVPIAPSAGMIAAAKSTTSAALTRSHATEIYRAMLAAAPAKQEG